MAAVLSRLFGIVGLSRLVDPPTSLADDLATRVSAQGVRALPWEAGSFSQASRKASEEHKFLLVYLHSPDHPNTDAFLRVLGDRVVTQYIVEEFVVWGTSVHAPDGGLCEARLGATSFPFLAVVYPEKGMSWVLTRVQEIVTPSILLRTLQDCMESAGAILIAQRHEVMEREQRRLLQAEQEASLAEAERIDAERLAREREEEEERERLRAEEEARLRAEQAEKEAREKEEQERTERVAREKAALVKLIPEEPSDDDKSLITTLRITMLDGRAIERRFLRTAAVRDVYNLAYCDDSNCGQRFGIYIPFPHRMLNLDSTLDEEGLCPRAVVIAKEVLD